MQNRPPSLSRVHAIIGFSLGLLLAASPVDAQCPPNDGQIGVTFFCWHEQPTAPVFSFSTFCSQLGGSGFVSYNLTSGAIAVAARGDAHLGMDVSMQTADDFVVDGPPGPTPIVFTAILLSTVDAASQLKLFSGVQRDSTSYTGPPSQSPRITLQHPVGEHFLLSMQALTASFAFRNQSGSGFLGFTALPAGYSLHSCQGYAAAPVAVRPTSWAKLKQYYR